MKQAENLGLEDKLRLINHINNYRVRRASRNSNLAEIGEISTPYGYLDFSAIKDQQHRNVDFYSLSYRLMQNEIN